MTKPKTTVKLIKAIRLANTYWIVGKVETTEEREWMYNALNRAGYYWSSKEQSWIKREGKATE